MKEFCEKCGRANEKWETGKTFNGLDEHHNPPKHLFEWIGEVWKGETYTLCRNCHTGNEGLHPKIIIPLMLKWSGLLRRCNSEFWIAKQMSPDIIRKCRNEIFIESKKWVEDDT